MQSDLFNIIITGACAYSVLKHMAIRTSFPVAVIVHNVFCAENLVDNIAILNEKLVSIAEPPITFKSTIESSHDSFLPILFQKSRYTETNMECLMNDCWNGKVEALCILIFVDIIPEQYLNSISMVMEFSDEKNFKFEKQAMVNLVVSYVLKNSNILERELEKMKIPESLHHCADSRFFLAAATLFMLATERERGDMLDVHMLEKVEQELTDAINAVEDFDEIHQLPELFCNLLQEAVKEHKVFVRNKNTQQRREGTILYDSKYYFVPEQTFAKICEPILSRFSVNRVKETLERTGVLCSQGRGRVYRTIKIDNLPSGGGNRYIWLRREFIDSDELELTLAESAGRE